MRRRRALPTLPEHRVVYWDAALYIAWLQDESRKPGEMEGIQDSAQHIEKGRSVLVASRFMFDMEVLDEFATVPERRAMLQRWINSRILQRVDYEPPVMALGREIRTYYKAARRRVPSAADCFHLATAIIYRVDALYTFDKGGRDGVNLLDLDGDVAGHPLKICKPPYHQLLLRPTD